MAFVQPQPSRSRVSSSAHASRAHSFSKECGGTYNFLPLKTFPATTPCRFRFICPDLLKAVDTEPEAEVLHELLASFAGCVDTLGAGCLDQPTMTELLRILDKLLVEHFERAVDRRKKHLDEDYDEVIVTLFNENVVKLMMFILQEWLTRDMHHHTKTFFFLLRVSNNTISTFYQYSDFFTAENGD